VENLWMENADFGMEKGERKSIKDELQLKPQRPC
jgi:hypothetical protein